MLTIEDSLLKNKIEGRLKRIVNVLLLNASFIDNIGLLNGKMGIAIFFYQYGCYTGNKIYTEYAGELIDEIYEEINTKTPVGFADGLTGIGWGIEYLVKNRFVDANTDETLAEIDNVIYRSSLYRPFLLESGSDLFGYGLYFTARLKEAANNEDDLNTLFRKQHLIYLIDDCERILLQKRFLEFQIDSLSVDTVNSFLWFILKMHEIGIFPVKVARILCGLPQYIEQGLMNADKSSGHELMLYLSGQILSAVEDDALRKDLGVIIAKGNTDRSDPNKQEDQLESIFVKNTLQQLIYLDDGFKGDPSHPEYFENFFSIIDSEDDWNKRLNNLKKDNIGLTWFAGLGLCLLRKLTNENIPELVCNGKSKIEISR